MIYYSADANPLTPIVGKAGAKDQALFKAIDMRVPLDISSKAMRVNGEIISVPTTHEERVQMRKKYGSNPKIKIIEKSPELPQKSIQKQDRKAKKER